MCPDQRIVDPELAELEFRLQRFQPGPSRLDRDRLMYLAGRTTIAGLREPDGARGLGWRSWRTAFCGMKAVAVSLLAVLIVQSQAERPRPPVVDQSSTLAGAMGQQGLQSPKPPATQQRRDVRPATVQTPRREAVAGMARPIDGSFRFRRPDELARVLGQHDSDRVREPTADGDQPESDSAADQPERFEQVGHLSCLEYRSVLLQELVPSGPGSAVKPATRKPSGA